MEREALKLATEGLERTLGSFEKDGKVVMKSMIRNELFAEMHLLLKKAKKSLAQPVRPPREWVGLTDAEIHNLDPLPHAMFDEQRIAFARAIEVKIKKKNT